MILGPRKVGKTTGIGQLSGFKNSLHYASADEALNQPPEWITEHWQAAKLASRTPILVIDEIQKVTHWSERIKALWDSEQKNKSNFKLVLLGSSSLDIGSGLDESLTGRFEVIPAHHWNFTESVIQFGYTLDEFLLIGGYPAAARFKGNVRRWQSYLKNSIIETVIGKDILRYGGVRKPALFRQTFELLSHYPAQEISYNKLLGQLQESGNVDLVKHYIELFEGAFLFKSIHKFSGSVIRQRSSSPKIFPLCPALYGYRHGSKEFIDPETRGRVFEAAVGSELAKLPGELFYWRDKGTAEVDYVYQYGRDLLAIEVKSGRRKNSHGIQEFLRQYPQAKPVFVTQENFPAFSKDVEKFLKRIII